MGMRSGSESPPARAADAPAKAGAPACGGCTLAAGRPLEFDCGNRSSSAWDASSSSSCSSSWSSSLWPRSEEAPNRSCRSLAIISLRWAIIASAPVARASAAAARLSASVARVSAWPRAARRAAISSGKASVASITRPWNHILAAAGIPKTAAIHIKSLTGLSRQRRPPGPLRMSPVDPFQRRPSEISPLVSLMNHWRR